LAATKGAITAEVTIELDALPPRQAAALALIAGYAPEDDAEAEHRRRMLELAGRNEDVFARTLFAPGHFTASAFVLSPAGDEILLIEHRRLGRWLQPGGHVDPEDPDLAAAAAREVREETGIVIDLDLAAPHGLLDLDVHAIPPRADRSEPAHEHFDVRFLGRARHRELEPSSDVRGARWVPLAEVMQIDTDDSVRRVLAKLERYRGGPR
jgi:8-oxo-dGTP pyrophosphatase MutT (NUDIX family)